MVVAYRVNPLTYWIAEKLVKIRTFSLPNLLAGRMLVPEVIQDQCTAPVLAEKISALFSQDNSELIVEFSRLHQLIRCDADKQAADAVLSLLDES